VRRRKAHGARPRDGDVYIAREQHERACSLARHFINVSNSRVRAAAVVTSRARLRWLRHGKYAARTCARDPATTTSVAFQCAAYCILQRHVESIYLQRIGLLRLVERAVAAERWPRGRGLSCHFSSLFAKLTGGTTSEGGLQICTMTITVPGRLGISYTSIKMHALITRMLTLYRLICYKIFFGTFKTNCIITMILCE
jgi:hypothetical protein